MSKLPSVGPEIVRLGVFLNGYLGLIAALRTADDSQAQKAQNLIDDHVKRLARDFDRCGISFKLPTSFEAKEDIDAYLLSLPSDVFGAIADQLFKKHDRSAEALFNFVIGVFAEMKSESLDADDRDKVIAETLSFAQQAKLPESVAKDCLENGLDGLKRLESFLGNGSAQQAKEARPIQGSSARANSVSSVRRPHAVVHPASQSKQGSGMGLMEIIKGHIIVVVIVVAVVSGGVVFSVVSWLNAERRRIMMEQNQFDKAILQNTIKDLTDQITGAMQDGTSQVSAATVLKMLDPIVFEKGDEIQVGRLFQSTFELATQSDVAKCDLCGDASLDWISVYPTAFAVKACRTDLLKAIRRGVTVRILVPSPKTENLPNLSAFASSSSDMDEAALLEDVTEAVQVLRDMIREISEQRAGFDGSLEVRSCVRPLFGNMWLRDVRTNTALAQVSIHTPGPSAAGGPWSYVRIGPSAMPFLERLAAEFNATWAASKPIE